MELKYEAISSSSCLRPTAIIDSDRPEIARLAAHLGATELPPDRAAVTLFEYVRDEILYEFVADFDISTYPASHTLSEGKGFCVQKAILLCALGRAAGIPTALVLSDLADFCIPDQILKAIGTHVLHYHGFNAFHIDDRWVMADASNSPEMSKHPGDRPVIFDGTSDALLPPTRQSGELKTKYLELHGMYAELPFGLVLRGLWKTYQDADFDELYKLGHRILSRGR